MSVFAVVARTEPEKVREAVQARYGATFYEYADNAWLISDSLSTKGICEALGIRSNQLGASAIVMRLDGYAGYGPTAAWNWLAEHPEARSDG